MPRDLTLAVAGHAKNTKLNIELLLRDRLHLGAPDKKGYYDKPDRYGALNVYFLLTDGEIPAGLKPALHLLSGIDPVNLTLITDEVTGDIAQWAEAVDDVQEVDEPLTALIENLADSPNPYLYVNWDESDVDDEQLIQLAHATGKIKVADLVQGLSELLPDEESDEQEDPEPEPQKDEKPTSRRRKPAKEEPEDLEESEENLPEDPAKTLPAAEKSEEKPQVNGPSTSSQEPSTLEEEVAAAAREVKTSQITLPVGETVTVPTTLANRLYEVLNTAGDYLLYLDHLNALKNMADTTLKSPLTEALAGAAEEVRQLLYAEVPYSQTVPAPEKPKKSAATGKTARVVWDEDAGEWKKAGRGRVRAGVRTGVMDEDGNVTEH